MVCLLVLLILLCLLFKSCGAGGTPVVEVDRLYETDIAPVPSEIIPSAENRRVNLIISEKYRITDDKPLLYVRFPEENIFDVVFTLKDADGEMLYRTDYVAPGTTAGIDGTAFLEKGSWKLDCVVSVYDRESGSLLSDSGKKWRKRFCVSAALMKRPLSKSAQMTGQISIPIGGFTDGRMMLQGILRIWQTEIRTVADLLDEIESETLYLALVTVDRRTLQIVLLKMQGYTTKEIALLVHLTAGAIYARLDHLRKKLRKIL